MLLTVLLSRGRRPAFFWIIFDDPQAISVVVHAIVRVTYECIGFPTLKLGLHSLVYQAAYGKLIGQLHSPSSRYVNENKYRLMRNGGVFTQNEAQRFSANLGNFVPQLPE